MTTEVRYDFDTPIERRGTSCAKWDIYGEDVLPLWVADMDFKSPPEVLAKLHERIDHGVFGYTMDYPALRDVIVDRMKTLYDWEIKREEILFIPGMVLALNLVTRTFGQAGDGVLMQTPVYGPFLRTPANNQKYAVMADIPTIDTGNQTFTCEIDYEVFENAITPQTSLFYLCNPHNPAGRAFTREELTKLADICMKHDVMIVSDEIHCDLLMGDTEHIPIAALSPEISQNTITLMAPSKTFNIPGLVCSVAIVQDEETYKKLQAVAWGSGVHVNVLGFEAALAAYSYGQDWLDQALAYMTDNRDFVVSYIQEHLPMLKTTVPEATYLAWIDARELVLPEGKTPYDFFLEEAKVALNPGTFFGKAGAGFVRLNYACPRATLEDGLNRIKAAIDTL